MTFASHSLRSIALVALGVLAVSAFVRAAAVETAASPTPVAITGRIDAQARGVVADGKTSNTGRINSLIAELSGAGGGTLTFTRGTYLTGTVVLLSNVTLQLDAGATILGSTAIADYPENAPPHPTSRLEYGRYALISAIGQHDVAIRGQGRIYGQGDNPNFTKKDLLARGWSANDAYLKRPFGLSFIGCQRVKVEDIKLENIAFWCEGYLDCDDVAVRGVTVDSKKHDYNNDGIDLDGCRNVRVSDCYFFVGDDAICLKASYRDCENITVTNCTASSLANGVKFGTASNFGFKNIAVSNIVLDGINAAGIALEIVDGGTLDGVTL
ncbi:MAG: glycosyl hydrolase family 28 protein, partial [Lacunisphaera sp.]